MDTKNIPIQQDIPLFWLSAPNFGDPIKIPGDVNAFFISVKTPLPIKYQTFLKDKDKWTYDKMFNKVNENIKSSGPKVFLFIDTEVDLLSKLTDDTTKLSEMPYNSFTYTEYKESVIDKFVPIVNNFINNGLAADHYILVGSYNTINKSGFLICGYYMKNFDFNSVRAYNLFESRNPYPVFKREAIEVLERMSRGRRLPLPDLPKWHHQNEYKGKNFHSPISHEPSYLLDKLYGKRLDRNDMNIEKLQKYINNSATSIPISPTISLEPYRLWSKDLIDEFNRNLYRMTIVPRGQRVFVIITEPNVVYINFGFKKFWSYEVNVECSRPALMTGIALLGEHKLRLFLTDLLNYEDLDYLNHDIDHRMTTIWANIIPNLHPKNDDIEFLFRPLGRVTDAVKIYEETRDFYSKFQFQVEGLVLIPRGQNLPLSYIYIPQSQTLKLFVKMKTETNAILYSLTDSGDAIIPVYNMEIHSKDKYQLGALDGYVVRFEITESGSLVPKKSYSKEFPDTYSFVKSILMFYKEGKSGRKIASELEQRAKNFTSTN